MSIENATTRVRVRHGIRNLGASRKTPYQVRWTLDGQPEKTKTFPTLQAAEKYRGRLERAVEAGELFDRATCEPVSWRRKDTGPTTFEFVEKWFASQWKSEWTGRTRRSKLEEVASWLPAL